MNKFLAAICLLSALGVSMHAQDFQLVVHPDNPTESVSSKDLSAWFLLQVTTWPSGDKVAPVDQSDEAVITAAFCEKVHGKSLSAIKSFWQKKIFSGKGVPPKKVASDEEVINFVKANPGAIGYVSTSANSAGVKVIKLQ
jgi:ABC-type phosphate transport system substrate-binding protein